MKKNYDFSQSKKNPYANRLKTPITIRIDKDVIEYFKAMAKEKGISCQSLINLYLRDCAETKRAMKIKWGLKRKES
ncbi:MAG: DUF6364 family protein [Candidatus Omnitrophota bacterium]